MMTKEDRYLIEKMKNVLSSMNGSLEDLENIFEGRVALIISAGPSAQEWRDVFSKIQTYDPIIICVKQSIELVDVECHFHFLNNWNLKKYKYVNEPVSIMTADPAAPCFGRYDLTCTVDKKTKETLSSGLRFSDHSILKCGKKRPVGPGIMYESVFYFLHFFGVTHIHTIGWDIADSKGRNSHFDDVDDTYDILSKEPSRIKKIPFAKYLTFIKCLINFPFEYYRYMNYQKCNIASMKNGEAVKVGAAVTDLKEWLVSEGVSLNIHGGSSWM